MTTSASGSPKLLLRAALHPSIASFSSSLRVVVAIMASTGAAPTGRGLVAAEHHLARADLCREVTERLGGEYQRVEIRLLQIIGLVASDTRRPWLSWSARRYCELTSRSRRSTRPPLPMHSRTPPHAIRGVDPASASKRLICWSMRCSRGQCVTV